MPMHVLRDAEPLVRHSRPKKVIKFSKNTTERLIKSVSVISRSN